MKYLMTILGLLMFIFCVETYKKIIKLEENITSSIDSTYIKYSMLLEETNEQTIEFDETELIRYIKKLKIKYPEITLAISKLESGNFTSDRFLYGNNLFGMQKALLRPTTALNVIGNYAMYNTWMESVIDFKFWQENIPKKILYNKSLYIEYLIRNYSENHLNWWFKITKLTKK
jgi:hypothetical protein